MDERPIKIYRGRDAWTRVQCSCTLLVKDDRRKRFVWRLDGSRERPLCDECLAARNRSGGLGRPRDDVHQVHQLQYEGNLPSEDGEAEPCD